MWRPSDRGTRLSLARRANVARHFGVELSVRPDSPAASRWYDAETGIIERKVFEPGKESEIGNHGRNPGTVKLVDLIGPAFDSLKVLIEPFEDRFHGFIGPLPVHVEVYAVF
jgi:hypothetical protein